MSVLTTPITDYGLIVSPHLAAFINYEIDRYNGELPKPIKSMSRDEFKALVFSDDGKNKLDGWGYLDADALEDYFQDKHIEYRTINNFTGKLQDLGNDESYDSICEKSMLYIALRHDADIFKQAYPDFKSIVSELQETMKDLLPPGLTMEEFHKLESPQNPCICKICGVDES